MLLNKTLNGTGGISALQKKVDDKITEISVNATQLPGVVVITDLRDFTVAYMCEKGLKGLGLTLEEVKKLSTEEYHKRYFNPEDYDFYIPKIRQLLESTNDGELISFFQQVKLKGKIPWIWHISGMKILLRDEENKPVLLLTVAIPIDSTSHITSKIDRLLKENNFLRKKFQVFARLTPREKEVLKLLALGKSSTETANELFISATTVDTHRKNIRRKLESTSFFDLCEYARAFDLI